MICQEAVLRRMGSEQFGLHVTGHTEYSFVSFKAADTADAMNNQKHLMQSAVKLTFQLPIFKNLHSMVCLVFPLARI